MKKISFQIIFFTLLAFAFSSCMQNNGYIGPLFGTWKVEKVECDNMEAPQMRDDTAYFWQFQSHVIRTTTTRDEMQASENFGEYRLEDNTMFLNFSDTKYSAPLGLPRVCELEVLELSWSKMTLVFHPIPDASETIYLKKW